ncbi:MAG: Rrf2 family transcriptional regulator [Lachnospiraceae bacterium]|nr:Rrf2 family transcriptional regulator [Lachnospiraceae bacterium]
MMISTKGRYALRVMLDLAGQPKEEYISLKAISDRQEISMKYLEAIVANLSKAGLLDSLRGKSGGYRLNKSTAQYSVGAIVRAVESNLSPVSCLEESKGGCDRAGECLTLPMWQKLDRIVGEYLDSVTLEDLLTQNFE